MKDAMKLIRAVEETIASARHNLASAIDLPLKMVAEISAEVDRLERELLQVKDQAAMDR